MKANLVRTFVITSALGICAASGCVADRPSRNSVFNENQYVRKDFLIRPGNATAPDPGWFMKTTIIATSTPNPLADQGVFVGAENGGSYVRFRVSQDKLDMLNIREISADADGTISSQGTREPEVLNSWPVTNVDLKYNVSSDGEKTNQYVESQELDWQIRQWVKLNFAKNDMSDLAPYGDLVNEFVDKCTGDDSATLHPDSFLVDDTNGYFQFAVDLTFPIQFHALASTSTSSTGTTTTTTSSVDTFCQDAFGINGVNFANMGRQNVTVTLMYSFARAAADNQITYLPLVIEEKDPIQKKYGVIQTHTPVRDVSTGLLGTRSLAMRYDPNPMDGKPIVYYFAPGFPDGSNGQPDYTTFFTAPGGIIDQTNGLFKNVGARATIDVRRHDDTRDLLPGQTDRQVGDVRYNMIRFMTDMDTGAPFAGVTQFVPDPRTGQILSSTINVANFAWQDYYLARLDYYEQSLHGAIDWTTDPGPCQDGDTMPLVPTAIANNHNGSSSLFYKMQQYLQKQPATYGFLGPQDFIPAQDADFFRAQSAVLPFQVFADPATNAFVIPEGQQGYYGPPAQLQAMTNEASFHDLMGKIDSGWSPPDVGTEGGLDASLAFLQSLQQATIDHADYTYMRNFRFGARQMDDTGIYNDIALFEKDARHCINGKWEDRATYVQNLLTSYWAQVIWHEFGHSLGLTHNFMASVDRSNFPHYQDKSPQKRDHIGMYSSSIMEYNTAADRMSWANGTGSYGWAPYDQGALGFIYGNNPTGCPATGICPATTAARLTTSSGKPTVLGNTVSGQGGVDLIYGTGTAVNKDNARWVDPYGYNSDGSERQYMYCAEQHMKYSPFCRQGDFGTTPAEIIANEIDNYEWQYLWRNFRQYHKYFDFAQYADAPTKFFTEARRFLSSWQYDYGFSELTFLFKKLALLPPQGIPVANYYAALAIKMNQDISMANQLYAATAEALVQQGSGQRPYVTVHDQFFGDTTQQGIIIDKLQAIQSFSALWQVTNYDPNQAGGAWLASFSPGGMDPSYETVAEGAVLSNMTGLGGLVFVYAQPLAVLQLATATHDPNFISGGGRKDARDWVGGWTFTREEDFLAFVRNIAVENKFVDETGQVCASSEPRVQAGAGWSASGCSYDPRLPAINSSGDPLFGNHSDLDNQFIGPDGKRWIWTYIRDRNTYLLSERDRNIATYTVQFTYNQAVYVNGDDGTGVAYQDQYPLKYMLDYFQKFN